VTFAPQQLKASLAALPTPRRYWVAYSGGLDSTVLVHAVAALKSELGDAALGAVHVDHGLHAASAQWATHCTRVCESLGIPCRVVRVKVEAGRGESLESAAREARYRIFRDLLGDGEALCTAHHQDDQAETLLLQLLRGAGAAGLAGMPRHRPLGRGWLLRPLLGFGRAELKAFAEGLRLSWVEDPSNFLPHADRNYLRHTVLPLMRVRWPGLASTLARSAGHCGECGLLLELLAEQDLVLVQGSSPRTLSAQRLAALDAARQRNVLRAWLKRLGLPTAPAARLDSIGRHVVAAGRDRVPLVEWPGAEVRRYRGNLYALRPLPRQDATQRIPWDMSGPLSLAAGQLGVRPALGQGLSAEHCRRLPVTVRFRRGGECCRPAGRAHRRDLKRLLQEQGVPPWDRDRLPLVYLGDDLAAVGDLWVCEPHGAQPGEAGLAIHWRPGPPVG
jgi:tRNA(Ile)-lysidine synthase